MRVTRPSMSFSPPSIPLPPFCKSRGGKTRAGQPRHGYKRPFLKRRLVLRVGHQDASAHSPVVQERDADIPCDLLREDHIRTFRFFEDTAEDEVGA